MAVGAASGGWRAAGEGPNGAVIHYRAAAPGCGTVTRDSHLLIDSGGQYDVGTTDVHPALAARLPLHDVRPPSWPALVSKRAAGQRSPSPSMMTRAHPPTACCRSACCLCLQAAAIMCQGHVCYLASAYHIENQPLQMPSDRRGLLRRADHAHHALRAAHGAPEGMLHARPAGAHRPGLVRASAASLCPAFSLPQCYHLRHQDSCPAVAAWRSTVGSGACRRNAIARLSCV